MLQPHRTRFHRILAIVSTVGLATPAAAQPLRLTFGDAVQMSIDRGPEIAGARHGATAADLKASATASQAYAKLRAEGNLLRWNEPLQITFGPMPAAIGMAPTTTVVREQMTSLFSISLAQPISGLFVLHHMVAIDRSAAEGARTDIARARLDTASRAAEAYLRLLQANATAEVAGKTLGQLEAQLERARALEQAGVLGRVDVLRLISTRDGARQGLLRAQTGVAVASATLTLALDLKPEAVVEVVDDLPDPPPPIALTEANAVHAATGARPELSASRERTVQAQEGPTVAKAQLLPNVMGVATYQHTKGQGSFQPVNAWFVGATLSWDIWDWGKTWDGVKEARARASQAEVADKIVRDQIAFDARRRLLEAKSAFETLAPARTSLQAAEEAHRIQTVRFSKGAASTTDVIDAEADLSRARGAYTQARYDYYLAQAALVRAMGEIPAQRAPVR